MTEEHACRVTDIVAESASKAGPNVLPRDPHATVLFGIVRDHNASILREANEAYDKPVPRFVEKRSVGTWHAVTSRVGSCISGA